ncbi:CopM family metallochaperone [Paracoccus luteus]|uniref:CopM family metallochaperone n=1 Tax=Paracoccus luteus TaxID=2508543 RepID=UPI0010700062|nr:DUF305 domain-containing protein [Paracoccus luteus]
MTRHRTRPAPFLRAFAAAAALAPLLALPAAAQTAPDQTAPAAGHAHDTPQGQAPAPGTAASTAAYMAAMDKMHMGMAIAYTGNADVDFVRGMIPHHQGAIDMARIELEHGTDPELREMAQEIIAAQETEIATMQAWLAANAPDAAQADAAKMESMAASSPVTGAPPEAKPAGAETPVPVPEAKPAGTEPPEARPAAPAAPPSN